jgi:hypothetical protein
MRRIPTALSHSLFVLCIATMWTPRAVRALSVELSPPAQSPAAEARLFRLADGSLALSWVEDHLDGAAELKFARLDGRSWSSPRSVASGDDWFVNWADTPAVAAFADGALLAHYLRETSGEKYAYEIRATLSSDEGKTWGESFRLHEDESATEHGFVSWTATGKDRMWGAWLDGRKFAAGEDAYGDPRPAVEEMTLRAALVASDGAILRRDLLDARVCDCCPTDIAASGDRVAVVYRDRSEKEVRDISMRMFDGSRWSEAITLGSDRWEVGGCPVNGPALALSGDRAAVAWFTAANGKPAVNVVLGSLETHDFGEAIRVDGQKALGRVELAWADGKAWVLWMEEEAAGKAVLNLRSIAGDGTLGTTEAVASCSAERSSGFPQMAATDGGLVVIWNTGGETPRVRGLLVPTTVQP